MTLEEKINNQESSNGFLKKIIATGAALFGIPFVLLSPDKNPSNIHHNPPIIESKQTQEHSNIFDKIIGFLPGQTRVFASPLSDVRYNIPNSPEQSLTLIKNALDYKVFGENSKHGLSDLFYVNTRRYALNELWHSGKSVMDNYRNLAIFSVITGLDLYTLLVDGVVQSPSPFINNIPVKYVEEITEDGERLLWFMPAPGTQGNDKLKGVVADIVKNYFPAPKSPAIRVLEPVYSGSKPRWIDALVNLENLIVYVKDYYPEKEKYKNTMEQNIIDWLATTKTGIHLTRNIMAAELYNYPGVLNIRPFGYAVLGSSSSFQKDIPEEYKINNITDYLNLYYKNVEIVKNRNELTRQNPANDLAQWLVLNESLRRSALIVLQTPIEYNRKFVTKETLDSVLEILNIDPDELKEYESKYKHLSQKLKKIIKETAADMWTTLSDSEVEVIYKHMLAISFKADQLLDDALKKLTDFDSDFYKWLNQNYSPEYVRSFIGQNIVIIPQFLRLTDSTLDYYPGLLISTPESYKKFYQTLLPIYMKYPELAYLDRIFPIYPDISNKLAWKYGWEEWAQPFGDYIYYNDREHYTEKLDIEWATYKLRYKQYFGKSKK